MVNRATESNLKKIALNQYRFKSNDKANDEKTKITSDTFLNNPEISDQLKEELLNPKSELYPKKKKDNDEIKSDVKNKNTSQNEPNSDYFGYLGLDKTVPNYMEIAEKTKEKAKSLENEPVDEEKLNFQEVGFEKRHKKLNFVHRKQDEVGILTDSTKNKVPESMRDDEGYTDILRHTIKNVAEKVKESTFGVVDAVKEFATKIAKRGEQIESDEKEKEERKHEKLAETIEEAKKREKKAKEAVARHVDSGLNSKTMDS